MELIESSIKYKLKVVRNTMLKVSVRSRLFLVRLRPSDSHDAVNISLALLPDFVVQYQIQFNDCSVWQNKCRCNFLHLQYAIYYL